MKNLFFLWLAFFPCYAQDIPPTLREAHESVVRIRMGASTEAGRFAKSFPGVFISRTIVATSYHCVEGYIEGEPDRYLGSVTPEVQEGDELVLFLIKRIAAVSETYDLALLEVWDGYDYVGKPAALDLRTERREDGKLYTMGYHKGNFRMFEGRRRKPWLHWATWFGLYRSSFLFFNPDSRGFLMGGMSGSPVFSEEGYLVGIVSAHILATGDMAFIPVEYILLTALEHDVAVFRNKRE